MGGRDDRMSMLREEESPSVMTSGDPMTSWRRRLARAVTKTMRGLLQLICTAAVIAVRSCSSSP